MKKTLYIVWACLYALCAGLGTISGAKGMEKAALLVIALIFFVPGFALLYGAWQRGDRKEALRLRTISIVSLSLTTLGLAALIVSAAAQNEAAVDAAYWVLTVVSSPMFCSQYWIVSLFLWGCLLSSTFFKKVK